MKFFVLVLYFMAGLSIWAVGDYTVDNEAKKASVAAVLAVLCFAAAQIVTAVCGA